MEDGDDVESFCLLYTKKGKPCEKLRILEPKGFEGILQRGKNCFPNPFFDEFEQNGMVVFFPISRQKKIVKKFFCVLSRQRVEES